MKNIEIVIDTDGTLKIDAVGFKGMECEKATRFLETSLGKYAWNGQSGRKPEFYQTQAATVAAGRVK